MGRPVCTTPVAIVANPDQEAESRELERFLRERGIEATHVPGLPTPASLREVRDGIVLFTKGFDVDAARAWLKHLLKDDDGRLIIVVSTSLPDFADFEPSPGAPILLLAAPVLAWRLVDVLRHHSNSKQRAH
ncbi:MAG: hypothetical protein AB1730_22675 [Myxococcota bacterium]|jgi:hypothetical protein